MGSTAYLGRISIRRRWRRYAGIALLLGVTAGLSIFAIAGARRTQSAYPRFLRHGNGSTVALSAGAFNPDLDATVAAFPEVKRASTDVGFQVVVLTGHRLASSPGELETSGTYDGRYLNQDRFAVTHGRLPDPTRPDEVAVNEFAAKRHGFRVGQKIELGTFTLEQFANPAFRQGIWPEAQRLTATVVGIGLFPEEILQDEGDRVPHLMLTPAYSRLARAYTSYGFQGLVLSRGNTDLGAVSARFAGLVPPGATRFHLTSIDEFHTEKATRPVSITLGLFGLIIGLAGLVLVGQAMSRLLVVERDERAILRALGADTAAIARCSLVGPVIAIFAGTVLAIAVAVAASPAMPIGPVRKVEVDAGVSVDGTVAGLGALAIIVVLLALFMALIWRESPRRVADRRRPTGRLSRVVASASSLGLGPSTVTGLRFALESTETGKGVPMRSVIAGTAIAVTALVASITFGASLDRLVHEPRLYGWNWDVAIIAGRGYGNVDIDKAQEILGRDRHIAAWSGAYFGADAIEGHDVPLLGMDPTSDVVPPTLHGRFLVRPGEIVLGPATAATLHKRIGDSVTLAGAGNTHRLTVVGLGVFPTVGIVGSAHTSLGVGAVVVPELVPGFDQGIQTTSTGIRLGPRALFVRYRRGTDFNREQSHLQQTTAPLAKFVAAGVEVVGVPRPAEIVNSSSIGNAPLLLAAALALGSMVSLSLALGTSVRRHRHDLAVLKTLGFTKGQIASTVFWHATTTMVVGLVIGIPLGAAVGRALWNVFAHQLDVVASPTMPLMAVAGIAVAGVVIANAVSAVPARAARRVNPTTLLRSE